MPAACDLQPTHQNIKEAYAQLSKANVKWIPVKLYGIVSDCDEPWRSGGTDFYNKLQVYDESTSDTVQVVCFAPVCDLLPNLSCIGDIIFLSNARLQSHNDKPQLMLQLRYNTPVSFCLFRNEAGAAVEPYYAPSGYKQGQDHPAALQRLRQLCRTINPDSITTAYMRKVKDLHQMARGSGTFLPGQEAQAVDLRCKVVAVEKDEAGSLVLWVWDCTDAHPLPLRDSSPPSSLAAAGERPPGFMDLQHRPFPLGSGTFGTVTVQLGNVPQVGSVVPVLVAGSLVKEQMPAVGAVVKLKQMAVAVAQGQVQAIFYTRSYWHPVQNQDFYDQELAARTADCCLNQWVDGGPAAQQQMLTVCSNTEGQRATIRQVLQAASEGKFGTFRVTAKVIRMSPPPDRLEEMCCPRQELGLPGGPMPVWLLRLHLADATGELDAIVFDKDGTTLFGLVATNLEQDLARKQELQHKVELLASSMASAELDPTAGWLDCCIRSYCLDASDPLSTAAFRVEDTVICSPGPC